MAWVMSAEKKSKLLHIDNRFDYEAKKIFYLEYHAVMNYESKVNAQSD